MSTKMTDTDWANVLEVFRACLPRRGRKATDDRLCLEAMHFFTVENVRWRALPERFGHWNSVWKRFDRLSKAGMFEAFFDTLAAMSASAHLIQMFDSTIVCPRLCSRRKGGSQGQALGRSRGGFTTKIHAKADNAGGIIAFDLTGGQVADTTRYETLLNIGPDITPRAALGDKGYYSKANRAAARSRSIAPVIPHKVNEKNTPPSSPRRSTRLASVSNRASGVSSASNASPCDAKNRPKLPFHRQLRCRPMLDQIRPHDLDKAGSPRLCARWDG